MKLSNKTHHCSTDPDALLARKSNAHPSQPSYQGHVLMNNRHALIVDCKVTQAVGTGERDAAKGIATVIPDAHQKTLGADKNYDARGFVAEMRRLGMTPRVAQNTARPGGSAIDNRASRHEDYTKSINARRGIEKVFGWINQWGGLRVYSEQVDAPMHRQVLLGSFRIGERVGHAPPSGWLNTLSPISSPHGCRA